MRVIVADDDRQVRSALRLFLIRRVRCPTIVEMADGPSLLHELQRMPADLLLLDWELPGYVNQRLVRLLRQITPSLRIIALSSRSEARDEALIAGVDRFISKGDTPDELSAALQEFQ
jgi:DNA-binding NarL/FixJ family response regulator